MTEFSKALGEAFKVRGRVNAEHRVFFTLGSPIETNKNIQGGCSDGEKYYYQVFMRRDDTSNQENNEVRIAKIDIETAEVVLLSENLSLNHANDITYNKKTGKLIVCHNKPHRNRISFLSPETLELLGSVELDVEIFGISYNEKKDIYAVGLSYGQSFCYLDADFKLIDGKKYSPTPLTKRYVTQGICSDDEHIYFALWDGRTADSNLAEFQNTIAVYAWSGEFVGLLDFNVGVIEPENMAFYDGQLLLVCGDKGVMRCFKLSIKN